MGIFVDRFPTSTKFFSFMLLALIVALPANDSFARARLRKPIKTCKLVANESLFVEIELRSNASDVEKSAAEFLKKSLKKLSKEGEVFIADEDVFRRGYIRIKLNLAEDFSEKTKFPERKISVDISSKEIEISYTIKDDVWTAVGVFLEEYCDAKFFAPLELGEEITLWRNLRLMRGKKIMSLPFWENYMASGSRQAKDFELINGQRRLFKVGAHGLSHIIPPEVRSTHPDWFASYDGSKSSSRYAQLDFLNEDARVYVSDLVKNRFRENPNLDIISIGVIDNGHFDTTELSRAKVRGFTARDYDDYSNLVFDFTNFIAKKNPENYVSQIAYLRTENPPDFKLEKNVMVVLCLDKGGWFNSHFREIDQKLMMAWARSGAGILGAYDYNYGSCYWLPRDISEYIADSIKLYREAGFKSYYAEIFPIWAYDIHKIWIATKLFKNPDLDFENLRYCFFKEYYKESSEYISEFFKIAQNSWRNRKDSPALWLKLYKRPSQLEILSNDDIENMEHALLNAEKTAKSEKVVDRVKEIRLVFDLTKTAHKIYFLSKKLWTLEVSKHTATEVLDAIKALEILRMLADFQRQQYSRETKYPKSDLVFWNLIDILNPSKMRARELLALDDNSICAEVEQILGKDFCEEAKLSFSTKNKNLLKNPSFENGLKHWTTLRSVTCKENMSLDSSGVRSGKFGLKLSSVEYAGISQRVGVSENKVYTLKCFGKGFVDLGATYYVRLAFLPSSESNFNDKISTYYLQIPSGNFSDFKKFEIVAKAPKNAKIAEIAFFSVNCASEFPIFLDDFSFEEN